MTRAVRRTSSAVASLRSLRVSSAAMTRALPRAAIRPADASDGRPIGAAARIRMPLPAFIGPRLLLAGSNMIAMGAFGYAPPIEGARTGQREPAVSLRDRIVPPMPPASIWGWAGPLLVTLFGGFLRFYRLGTPHAVVFDETYYVPDAYGILKHGVEISHVKNSDFLLAHGGTHILLGTQDEYSPPPPLGKIMIAVGEWLFGLTPFGWRFAAAVVGTLAILMTARIARRMTRSTLLGCVAGLLLALDGLEFVMSRTALLDIFVMFWVLAAFGALVVDRDRSRARIAAAVAAGTDDQVGPRLGIRWWRVAAGVCLGCAVASKWNGIWYLPAFVALTVAWDLGARRAAGFTRPWRGVLVSEGKWLPVSFVVVPLAAYLASWSGWLASPYGYDRNWAAQHGNHTPVLSSLDSLYQYNRFMLQFGLGLTTGHPHKSPPWTWLWLWATRPVSFYYATPKTCGVPNCSQEVLAIGTPFIWSLAVPVLLACIVWWLVRRGWGGGGGGVGGVSWG